ncbi:MAG: cupin domain-containing protein [Paracoccaceae bacterium]|nr:cupin domain-containing protein [Paracoccaceae bacterium]MDE3237446.1 cupin domain-containing protein [Paracoccaceae bacterium]
MPVIRKSDVSLEYPTSAHIARGFGEFTAKLYSDDGGLTQFGAFVEVLPPGSRSGNAHWHEHEDEFIYVLEGTLRVCEGDLEHDLLPGDAAAFRANHPVGHFLKNVSSHDVSYLVVGTRAERDVVHLTDEDGVLHRTGKTRVWTDTKGQTIDR